MATLQERMDYMLEECVLAMIMAQEHSGDARQGYEEQAIALWLEYKELEKEAAV